VTDPAEATAIPTEVTAESTYWDADERLRSAHTALAGAADPGERARLLTELADAQDEQARVHHDAFGPDPLDDEGGRDLAESLAYSALLYRLLADVEAAVAEPVRGRRVADSVLEPHAGTALEHMAATPDLRERTELLEDVALAVAEVAGAQAVETLWCLPSPGYSGWMTIADKDAWRAERGYGPGSEALGRARLVGGRITITRRQRALYLLGLPAAARLLQCLQARRAGRGVVATVAAVLALVSVVTSIAGSLALLYAGWLGLHHADISRFVLPIAAAAVTSVVTGSLAEIPYLAEEPGH